MRLIETKTAESELLVAVNAQLIEQAGSGSLRCRGRIVHLMRQIASQLAEGVELLRLLFDARNFADAIQQHGNADLPHRGHSAQHLGEDFPVEIESPGIGDNKAMSAMRLHTGEREYPGNLSGAAN